MAEEKWPLASSPSLGRSILGYSFRMSRARLHGDGSTCASRRSRLRRLLPGSWHKAYCARHMREARAVEVRTDAAIKRLTRERQRTRLGRVEDEAAERRHRVRAGAIRADELQVDRRVDDGDERVVPFDGHAAPARRVCALQAHTRRE